GHVPVAPVYSLDQALDNPWLDIIGMRQVVEQPDKGQMHVLASPIRINGERLPSRTAPYLGQDSDTILHELGYDAETIADMRRLEII
ncbi:MAG: CoA transferase, partial [Sphingorhabdus sp.]